MSKRMEMKLVEDRALRDAALALVKADIHHLRADFAAKSMGERVIDRASEGAADIFEEAKELADDHKGVLATLIAAIFIWFARHPIASLFTDGDEDDASDERWDEDWDDDEADEYYG